MVSARPVTRKRIGVKGWWDGVCALVSETKLLRVGTLPSDVARRDIGGCTLRMTVWLCIPADTENLGVFFAISLPLTHLLIRGCTGRCGISGRSTGLVGRPCSRAPYMSLSRPFRDGAAVSSLVIAARTGTTRRAARYGGEILAWLTLGAAARRHDRPLLRPLVHAFVRGIGGAVATFPEDHGGPVLWLAAEDKEAGPESDDSHAHFSR